jgi:RNA polymerase primary sigma factor
MGRLPGSEAVAAGCVGLITAVDRFDVSGGLKFITYAVWWIRQALHEATHDENVVRRPCNQISFLQRFHKLLAALEEEHGRALTAETVVAHMGFSKIQGDALLGLLEPVIRLDKPAYAGHDRSKESTMTIGDIRLVDPIDAEAMDQHLDQQTMSLELA